MIPPGTHVKVHRVGIGERGLWRVAALPPNRPDDDPAHDVEPLATGRRRYLREARLRPVRSPHAHNG